MVNVNIWRERESSIWPLASQLRFWNLKRSSSQVQYQSRSDTYSPEGFEDARGVVQNGYIKPLWVMILKDVSCLPGSADRGGLLKPPALEVNQPDHLLLSLRKVQNCILQGIHQLLDLSCLSICVLHAGRCPLHIILVRKNHGFECEVIYPKLSNCR